VLTSALAGGLGSLAGSGSGAAGSAVGEAAKTAGLTDDVLAGAVPASKGVGITQGAVSAPSAGGLEAATLPASSAGSESMFGGMGKELAKEGLQTAMSEEEQQPRFASPSSMRAQSPYTRQKEEEQALMAQRGGGGGFLSNPFSGFAEGGLTTLKGGGIAMRDGQYVIPADVVSAIGNGSSKAGAKFLEQAFNHYINNGPPEGVKPPSRAGSLAEQRTIERMQRQSA